MPDTVHQHPDGMVFVRTVRGLYGDTTANTEGDFQITMPALPAGADDRIYVQGVRHPIMGGGNLIEEGPMPWPLGDLMINNVTTALARKAARENPPPTQADLDLQAANDALATRRDQFTNLPDVQDFKTRLKDATPAQMDNYLANNMTNLAEARAIVGRIMKYLASTGMR